MQQGTWTLGQIRLRCKQESNTENDPVISDAEWDTYIASSLTRLYAVKFQKFAEGYAQVVYQFNCDGNTDKFPLPVDFLKLTISGDNTWAVERNIATTGADGTPGSGQGEGAVMPGLVRDEPTFADEQSVKE